MTRLAVLLFTAALSFAALAQSGKVYRIGVLEIVPANANRANMDELRRGLREAGYVEGKNIVIDYRSADGRADKFPELAADLVRAKPDIIITRGSPATVAAKAAGSIPIVMATSGDPVGTRIVSTLARPGGNVTGLTAIVNELTGKRVEILKDLLPRAGRIGAIVNMANPVGAGQWKDIEQASRAVGLQVTKLDVRDADSLNRALQTAAEQGASALLINGAEAVVMTNRRAIVAFAAAHKLPAMYSGREFVDAGGLMSYGVHYPHLYFRAASYVDRILKGAKPGDLPIERPTRFELIINLKTASALGITIPRELQLRADEVIQ